MAENLRILGENVTAYFTIGDSKTPIGGSMLNLHNFHLKPISEIRASKFLGESRERYDFIMSGFEFGFDVDVEDSVAWDLIVFPFVAAWDAGQPLPDLNLVVIRQFRTLSSAPQELALGGGMVMIMDNDDTPGMDQYVKQSFTGRAPQCVSI